jgi:hypothetical protein
LADQRLGERFRPVVMKPDTALVQQQPLRLKVTLRLKVRRPDRLSDPVLAFRRFFLFKVCLDVNLKTTRRSSDCLTQLWPDWAQTLDLSDYKICLI